MAATVLGKTGRPANSQRLFLKKRSRELSLGSDRTGQSGQACQLAAAFLREKQRTFSWQRTWLCDGNGQSARINFFLKERSKELFLGNARVILAPARLTRQESLFAAAKPRFFQLLSTPRETPSSPAEPGHLPLRGRQAPSGRGLSWLRHDWGSFLLHFSLFTALSGGQRGR